MRKKRAVFLDRDGVVNSLLYFAEEGRIDTPLNPSQFWLIPGVAKGIKKLQTAGFQVVFISNQPGIGKGQLTPQMFDRIREKAHHLLQKEGVRVDGEYYCFHHPDARERGYRKLCLCRKPEPGLIFQAVRERALEMKNSYMVGDGFVDIEAGQKAGCRTILIGHVSSLLTQMMKKKKFTPTYVAENFWEAVEFILERNGRVDAS